jgi:hypothetical protein
VQVWLRRVRAVVGIGLVWAAGGLGVAGVLELMDNLVPAAHPVTRLVDMWPQTLAILFFACGVVFAVVLGVARGGRRFEESSLRHFAACGAAAGLALGLLAMALGAGPGFAALTTLFSAAGGAGSLALARMAGGRGLLDAGAGTAGARLAGGEAREPRGRRD